MKKLSSSKIEKTLLIILPVLAVLISLCIMLPQALRLSRVMADVERLALESTSQAGMESPESPVAPAQEKPYLVSRQSSDGDSCAPDSLPLKLMASSTEYDLHVVVRDIEGNSISGSSFELSLTSPAGAVSTYYTTQEGSCYIVDLKPGAYRISMSPAPGYTAADPISCTVRSRIEYVPIPNITQMLDIVDITAVADEVKDNSPTTSAVPIPQMSSPGGMGAIEEEVPVTDSSGNTVYSYSYEVGPNGFLLYSGSGLESDVLPIDENYDGVLDYGLRYVQNSAAGENSSAGFVPIPGAEDEGSAVPPAEGSGSVDGYYVSVSLFNADNTPVAEYAITARPLMETVSSSNYGWRSENGRTYFYDAEGKAVTGLVSIDGKLYYFNPRGEKARSLGVDVSYYNGNIDWQAVKAQGIDFAIIRLGGRGWSSGLVYDDTSAQTYLQSARAAGLKIGVYFYSTAINAAEAVQEASAALARLGGLRLDYPVFIDMEYSGDYPLGRADTLSAAQRLEIINAFCKTIMSSGYSAGLYSGQYFLNTAIDYKAVSQYSLWLANYTELNSLPSFAGHYDIWQFTDSGQVNGIVGPVDLNVIF